MLNRRKTEMVLEESLNSNQSRFAVFFFRLEARRKSDFRILCVSPRDFIMIPCLLIQLLDPCLPIQGNKAIS